MRPAGPSRSLAIRSVSQRPSTATSSATAASAHRRHAQPAQTRDSLRLRPHADWPSVAVRHFTPFLPFLRPFSPIYAHSHPYTPILTHIRPFSPIYAHSHARHHVVLTPIPTPVLTPRSLRIRPRTYTHAREPHTPDTAARYRQHKLPLCPPSDPVLAPDSDGGELPACSRCPRPSYGTL